MENLVSNYNKILGAFNKRTDLHDIGFNTGDGEDGTHYMIFDSCDELERFMEFAREELGLDENAKDYEIEDMMETNFVFSDEYTTCSDCGHIIRTSPDSYFWQPDFYLGDGFIVCKTCFDDVEDYQENYIKHRVNNPKEAVNGLMTEKQLENLGFRKYNQESFEHGLHNGQTDNPNEIYDELSVLYYDVLFVVDEVSQFYITFSVWVRGEI
jgi:hypothetical protein